MDKITTRVEENAMASPVEASAAEIDLWPGNPFRPLDWRWGRAGLLLERRKRPRRRDDGWVARAGRFRAALGRCGGDLGHHRLSGFDPPVLAASRIRYSNTRLRWELEARLLAGQSDREVAARVGLAPGVVEAYEALFYSVRDGLDSPDWVALVAIGIRPDGGPDPGDVGTPWKLLAYHGGPLVLDALLDPDRAGEFDLLLRVMAIPVTPENATELIRLNALALAVEAAEAARSAAPVSGPVTIPPFEVAIGPRTLPLGLAECAPDALELDPEVVEVGLAEAV